MTRSVKTRKIVELLRRRHSLPEWASFAELGNGTGMQFNRSMDFFALNCYPSKRFLKVGYEIKVSRGDFANELANPLKRDWMLEVCDECYFAAPAGLIKSDEVPENWGLLELTKGSLRIKKRAQQRHIETLPMAFVASLARRMARCKSEGESAGLPAAFWLRAGEEVSEEDLVAVANEAVQASADSIKEKAFRAGEDSVLESARYKGMDALYDVVRKALGYQYTNAEYLEKWFQSQDGLGLNKMLVRELESLQQRISNTLEEDKKVRGL